MSYILRLPSLLTVEFQVLIKFLFHEPNSITVKQDCIQNVTVHIFWHIDLFFDNYNMPDKHLYENKVNLQVYAIVKSQL